MAQQSVTSPVASPVKAPKPPKAKCCVSKKRCSSCPVRMLKEGTLPEGYGVKKRVLVKVDPDAPDIVRPVKKSKKKSKKKAEKAKKAKKARQAQQVAAGKSARRLDRAA